jgi:ferredoxin
MNRRDFLTSSALTAALAAAQSRVAPPAGGQARTATDGRGGMHIDRDKCVACGNCIAVCPMGAIYVDPAIKRSTINYDECVECSTCLRNMSIVCPVAAFSLEDVAWPRSVRREFSNPLNGHPSTGVMGRGTEEVKTNDVTNRIKVGEAGCVIEFGRPGVGARFRDIQKVTMALAQAHVQFEKENPLTFLIADQSTGVLRPELLNEKVMSAIAETKTRIEHVPEVLDAVDRVSREIDTVLAVAVSTRCDENGEEKVLSALLEEHGYSRKRAKTNLGLGRATNTEKKGDRA